MSLQHILKNSSVSGKEPLASQLANGELSINYHADGPFLCCKDTAGNVRRVAGVWVATTAPGTPFPGELWLDISITPSQLKVYKDTTDGWILAGSVNSASTASEGIVRLATSGDTQAGTNATSAVTPASLQSKISDSTSTVSSTTIASSTAVKSVGDLASAALPKSGGTITGTLEIGNSGQLRFEGSSNDAYETTLAVEDPTATRTITLPNRTGTVITTGDSETVTNTMLAGSIADSKLSTITTADKVSLSALNIDGGTDIGAALSDADLFIVDDGANGTNRKAPVTRISDYTFGKISGAVTIANNGTSSLGTGVIVNSNVSNTAAIAVSKLADGTARQLLQTDAAGTGVEWTSNVDVPGTLDVTGATTIDSTLSVPLGSAASPSIYPGTDTNTGIYSPGADQLALSTGGTGRLFVGSDGSVGVGGGNIATVPLRVQDTGNGVVIQNAASGNYAIGLLAGTGSQDAYVFQRANAPLIFGTNNTERLRVDSSGNLGLGTSNPNAKFVLGSSGGYAGGSAADNCQLVVQTANATSRNGLRIVTNNYGSASSAYLDLVNFGSKDLNIQSGFRITGGVDSGGGNSNPYLSFSTVSLGSDSTTATVALSERMRIDNDGGILQTSSNNAGFTVSNNSTGNVGTLIGVNTATTAGTGFNFILCWSSSFTSERFKVQGNGDTRNANNVFGGISDIKLKENIVSSGSQWNDLKALQVRKYNFKEGETHTQIGLIAQEVELVSPGLVAETPDRDKDGNDLGTTTKSVNYSVLYMKAVKALQEAMERIETLEAKVAALEAA